MTGDTEDGERSWGFEARERSAWQRRSPVGWRLVKLTQAIGMVALAYVSTFVLATLSTFYPGTGSIGARGPDERPVRASVESCQRAGPLSTMGLGYWWVCHVRVATADRGDVEAVVDRSIVSKEDVGRTVDLWEACGEKPGAACSYGKAVGAGWQIYEGVVRMLGRVLIFLMLVSACFYLLATVLGAPRYLVFNQWWQRKTAKK
ncbi:hypothetical protein Acy02nite_91020 [Actinoplanes cyaneus]|uniref:Uncharacterized protein n=1 Tax=Actinoplanes cyaneus TaxID=52696 RepID=A0A919ITZ1_9ACTN|nr:DUF6346 domain-containing protein [Actinoplanes cyaneus]MCW2144549.1 hypothetical protein [Actinoplanes cyaneus]GID71221.1 hypothetical protein Acy02nite_91020 [Actinoplanes cyaneus]